MEKYDFGYSIEKGTTNEWAFNLVKEKSIVLELGPAVGNLTKHLLEEKECTVDIIEIDAESGMKAKNFAREAILGANNGNLNNDLWYGTLKDRRYDYIVALDVLEHLENPEHVLSLLKELLSDDGKIVLSIPNVAHNAVILELLENKFPYSDLGLLDRTHIHFFSYHTILQMIQEAGFHISLIDSIQKAISDTEFSCSYKELPIEIEHYLRGRKLGDVYQFLLVLKKEKGEQIDNLKEGILEDSLYESKVFVDGLLKNMVSVKGGLDNFEIGVNLTDYPGASSLRVVPVEGISVVVSLEVYAVDFENEKNELDINWTTGIKIDSHTVILSNDEYEINYSLKGNFQSAYINGKCILIDNSVYQICKRQNEEFFSCLNNKEKQIQELEIITDSRETRIRELEIAVDIKKTQIQELEIESDNRKTRIQELETAVDIREIQIQELNIVLEKNKLQIQELNKEIDLSQNELKRIKNTRIYKFFNKLCELKKAVYKINKHGETNENG